MNVESALETASFEILGRMSNSSNATFLVAFDAPGDVRGIYKPLAGERPLWDFPAGLHKREVAAHRLDRAMGLGIVPPTVLRDGPHGEGSVQLHIDHDPRLHYFTFLEEMPETHPALRAMAVFDFVANNTDRKGGHVLMDRDGRVWGIDHGVCFSSEFKLRTVIWDFGGEEIPDDLLSRVAAIAADVPDDVAELLFDDEVEALVERAEWLLGNRTFPSPSSRYQYPWPIL